MARLKRRRLLWGIAAVLPLAGCMSEPDTDDPDELTFFRTRVEADKEFDVHLDFLEGDEVTLVGDVRSEGTATIRLLHSGTSILDETIEGPGSETIERKIEQRNDEFHKLVILTGNTPVDIEVTVLR